MVGYKRNYLHIWYLDLFQELQYLSLSFQYLLKLLPFLFQVLQYLSTVQQQLGEIFLFICIKPDIWASLALNMWSVIQNNNMQICKLNLKRCSLFLSAIFSFFLFSRSTFFLNFDSLWAGRSLVPDPLIQQYFSFVYNLIKRHDTFDWKSEWNKIFKMFSLKFNLICAQTCPISTISSHLKIGHFLLFYFKT